MLKAILDDCIELSEECISLRNTLGDFEINKDYIELYLETQEDCYEYMKKQILESFGSYEEFEIFYKKKSKKNKNIKQNVEQQKILGI